MVDLNPRQPKVMKDWRPASMDRLPKAASKLFEKGRELVKEAKGCPNART